MEISSIFVDVLENLKFRKKDEVDSQIFGCLFDLILGVGNWGLGIDV